MDKQSKQEFIAKRVALELLDGELVNLGIGLPTIIANYVPADRNVLFHSENGFIGLGPEPIASEIDETVVNAGGKPVTIQRGGCFFDSATSFGIIRGGHVSTTVLGALQVASNGDIANYLIPGKLVPGMGGAMDLLGGSKRVIVAMEHTIGGRPKLLRKCTLPLSSMRAVDLIVTEMGVIRTAGNHFELLEYNPEFSLDDIAHATDARIKFSPALKPMFC